MRVFPRRCRIPPGRARPAPTLQTCGLTASVGRPRPEEQEPERNGAGVDVESPFPKPEGLLPVAKVVAEGAVPLDLLEIRAWGLNPRGLWG